MLRCGDNDLYIHIKKNLLSKTRFEPVTQEFSTLCSTTELHRLFLFNF